MIANTNKFGYILITVGMLLGLGGCGTTDSQAAFTSAAPRNTDTLITPPGMSSPDLNTNYKMDLTAQKQSSYQVSRARGMSIVTGGSQRWLVIESQSVDRMMPVMLAYINQLGLTVKYQNPALGVIQTDWSSRNTKVPQGASIRGLFDWIGWGGMYSLNSMYLYRVTLWQDGHNVVIMDTNYQMDEVYEGCGRDGISTTSSFASSDTQRTKWITRPSNPQLELEFLAQFMAFAGTPQDQVKKIVKQVESAPKEANLINNNQVIVNDQFDRAWWRTAVALDRIDLGVVDKNRTMGEYYVYPLQAQLDNPDPGFMKKWFGKESANQNSAPKPLYTIKLVAQGNQTVITMLPYDNQNLDKDFSANQKKYMSGLAQQLQ